MNPANLQLSTKEMELVTNADWILTKNGIMRKAWLLLEKICSEQEGLMKDARLNLPAEIFTVNPKISKGENYRGLPYLVLDNPRYFKRDSIFTIRTMFWWGHFFSITLHVSGALKKELEKTIISSYEQLNREQFYTGVSIDEWQHHFENDNYVELEKFSPRQFEEKIKESSFIKIAKKIPLKDWDMVSQLVSGYFSQLITPFEY